MTGYTRKDTANNISDGSIINADDLDNEFDGVQAAFHASTGHTHDGTAAEGAAITKVGPVQDVLITTAAIYPKTTNTVDLGTSSLKYKDAFIAGNETVGGTLAVTGVATLTAQPVLSSLTASSAVATDASKGLVSVTNTGTGNNVLATSPTLVTPILGTPTSGTVTNLTGTASININGTVGATTANTVAATTLTTSSTVTLNGGTANGVAYLNGTKVLTTGAALTFDGTNLGLGTATATGFGRTFAIASAAASNRGFLFKRFDTNADTAFLYSDDSNFYLGSNSGPVIFSASNAEGMRLTSTGLGIGTSLPGVKLDVTGAGRFNSSGEALTVGASALAANTAQYFRNTSGYGVLALTSAADQYLTGVVAGDLIIASNGKSLRFGNASTGTLQATLDSSGNLGLGVTPSAWGSGSYKGFQIGGSTSLMGRAGGSDAYFMSNTYYDQTNYRYVSSLAAASYSQSGGTHNWFNAPSGTAGNPITFTQAMTLDASGNLLVGVTSPGVNNVKHISLDLGGDGYIITSHKDAATGSYYDIYAYNNSIIGSVTQNGTTGVLYNTSSDYRLKNITGPITTSGAYIDSLNPVEGTWKADGSTFVGLIAHEVQEASRTNVATGTKDGEQMQGMDYSSAEIIANLIAECQSLRKRLTALEAK